MRTSFLVRCFSMSWEASWGVLADRTATEIYPEWWKDSTDSDRIDLQIELPPPTYDQLMNDRRGEGSPHRMTQRHGTTTPRSCRLDPLGRRTAGEDQAQAREVGDEHEHGERDEEEDQRGPVDRR